MKISRSKLNSVYTPPISDNISKKASPRKVSGDKVEFSAEAKKFSAQKTYVNIAVKDISSTASSEKLSNLKNKVFSGTYNIPSDKIADAILGKNK